MTKVVGVRFRNVGKIYYFSPKDYEIKTGDHVIVETARGIEYGKVELAPREVGEEDVVHPLKEVLRVATKEDDEREAQNRVREREAFKICQKKIREHGMEMKLIDAEYTFDNNKVLFYFTADGRIDFRQLVKDLAAIFKTRIELRQIGVRDETKILGGIGICGRCLCCHTYLSEFAPVSPSPGSFLFSSSYVSCSFFRQHINLPHTPEIFVWLRDWEIQLQLRMGLPELYTV